MVIVALGAVTLPARSLVRRAVSWELIAQKHRHDFTTREHCANRLHCGFPHRGTIDVEYLRFIGGMVGVASVNRRDRRLKACNSGRRPSWHSEKDGGTRETRSGLLSASEALAPQLATSLVGRSRRGLLTTALATGTHDVGAMDFVRDRLALGGKIGILTLLDTYSRFAHAVDARVQYRAEKSRRR